MAEVMPIESADTSNAIDSKIMDILNPSLHHHDLLQSYVRAPVDGISSSKHSDELENLNKNPSSLGTCLAVESSVNLDKESCISNERRKKRNDQKQSKHTTTEKSSIESEMTIQKKKK